MLNSDAARKLVESFEKRKRSYESMAASSAISFVTSDKAEHKFDALAYLSKAQIMTEIIEETCMAGV